MRAHERVTKKFLVFHSWRKRLSGTLGAISSQEDGARNRFTGSVLQACRESGMGASAWGVVPLLGRIHEMLGVQ